MWRVKATIRSFGNTGMKASPMVGSCSAEASQINMGWQEKKRLLHLRIQEMPVVQMLVQAARRSVSKLKANVSECEYGSQFN